MPHGRQHWTASMPFVLPNGAVAEGRPDVRTLLAARTPHEKLVKEGMGEKSTAIRQAAAEKLAAQREAAASGRVNKSELADFIGADVPSAMLGSTFAKLKESVGEVRVAVGSVDPLAKPRRPSRVGTIRLKDTVVEVRNHARLHEHAQHSPTRTAFDAAGFSPTKTGRSSSAGVGVGAAGAGGRGGMGMGTGTLGGFGSAAEMERPSSPPPAARFVRVGVPVAPAPGAPTTLIVEDDRPGSRMLSRSGVGSRFLPPSGTSAGMGMGMDAANSPTRMGADGADAHLIGSSMISFRHATADLPVAATVAVRRMVEEHRPVTVAAIHQRRPPYLDMGPARPVDYESVYLHPEQYQATLRRHVVDAFGEKRRPFVMGCAPPWQQSKTAAFQTFDVSRRNAADGVRTQKEGGLCQPVDQPLTFLLRFSSSLPPYLSCSSWPRATATSTT
jgi:hypothetical protein